MTNTTTRSFALCLILCGTLLASTMVLASARQAAGAAPPQPASAEDTLSPEDQAARARFETVCSACHEAAIATTTLRTSQEWGEILELMASFGASATETEFVQIQRYLNRRYGRVNLNRAPVAELKLVLDVSEEVARAIVDYRMTMRLVSADDLKNVMGFPAARIDALKPHLQF